jgi:hypothetical protein
MLAPDPINGWLTNMDDSISGSFATLVLSLSVFPRRIKWLCVRLIRRRSSRFLGRESPLSG